MSFAGYLRALYDYNEWATGHVLDAAAGLSEADLTLEQGASFGSVLGNLSHIAWAQHVWLSRWIGVASPEPSIATFDELRAAFDRSHADLRSFCADLTDAKLASTFAYTDTRSVQHERPYWQSMLHVANHGTHHRAETAMVLTSLGRPPRQLDYIFFEIERAGGAPRLT